MKIACIKSQGLIPYQDAILFMKERVDKIINKSALSAIWLLEHDNIYTAGPTTLNEEILNPQFPVYNTARGGKCTYHGPGQRIIYFMLDLNALYQNRPDIKDFIKKIGYLGVSSLKYFNLPVFFSQENIGIWTQHHSQQEIKMQKIASIGIKMKKWVTSHGLAVNISPNLEYFKEIVPCGIKNCGVTSMHRLGKTISLQAFDQVLLKQFIDLFNCEIFYEEQIF